ncbi:MAG: hypothetical protein COT14_01205 [Candidatus Diapherotrites archaeon CG08_land_8_20_14_0_20_30_16]|nr:MAG: hypothetical protein COT14_01205 [Candidatus Diapherotrites archaeon CG08_land_8_20_14_0_20_30_16]
MIGKPEWFTRRKYLGWGIYPKTWQGWVYIIIFIAIFAIFQLIPFWSLHIKLIVTTIWIAILLADVIHIMLKLKKDERDKKHEAIADRNALWVLLGVLIVGILYQSITSALQNIPLEVDYFLVAALLAAVLIRAFTNYYLDLSH